MQDSNTPGDARAAFRARQANAAPYWAERAPVLDAYRDGGQLALWCPHERRWHRHGACRQAEGCANRGLRALDMHPGCTCPPGSGDGHRGAHCYCWRSPYRENGYILREAGELTPAVEAAHPETWPCTECQHGRQCSCGTVRQCPDDWLCAPHADPECASCWTVHGGPGYGYCRAHGMITMHAHPDRKLCLAVTAHAGGDGVLGPVTETVCDVAAGVTAYYSPDGATRHAHCPACWAEDTLRAKAWPELGEWGMVPPPCKGCRDLVTEAVLARVADRLDDEAGIRDRLREFCNGLADEDWTEIANDIREARANPLVSTPGRL